MKIVTAIYELWKGHGLGHYRATEAAYIKGLKLLPDDKDIKYIIYTDELVWNNYNTPFKDAIANKNAEVKFFDLNQSEFNEKITKIKTHLSSLDWQYYEQIDKHTAVKNYAELMLEKFNFVKNNIEDDDDFVVWLDVGLFLNSCNFPWRWWIGENCHKKIFFDKLYEFTKDDFLIIQSSYMPITYRQALEQCEPNPQGSNLTVSGGLWGGNAQKAKTITAEFINNAHELLDADHIISDQEAITLSAMRNPEQFKYLTFHDWYDYQRVFLEILGVYDPQTYDKDNCTLENL
jgi:hypothetical protein